jgi:hypothetical protein
MATRTLRQDVSEVPVLIDPAIAEAFIPNQPDDPSESAAREDAPSPDAPSDDSSQTAQSQVGRAEVTASDAPALSERDRAVLTFEKQYWKYSGAKEQAIRDRFELSPTRYYQVLNALLDRPEAQEFEPMLVKRLRRQRATRQRARSTR